jgi:hypothetical protein
MTPKEKAIDFRFSYWKDVDLTPEQARQCALIAVDEIMEFMKMDDEYTETSSNANSKWVYFWKQVKEELQKL